MQCAVIRTILMQLSWLSKILKGVNEASHSVNIYPRLVLNVWLPIQVPEYGHFTEWRMQIMGSTQKVTELERPASSKPTRVLAL